MNAIRMHRRWLAERLFLLLPAFLAGLAVVLGLGIRNDMRPSFKLLSLSLALLLNAVLGYFLIQTAVCGRLLARGLYRDARIVRRSLLHVRGVAGASLLLLAVLGSTPLLFPEPKAPAPLAMRTRAFLKEAALPLPVPGDLAPLESAAATRVKQEEVASSPPVVLDILAPLPHSLADDLLAEESLERDPFYPLRLPGLLADAAGSDDDENRMFAFDFGGFQLRFSIPDFLLVDRSYLPDEKGPAGDYPDSIRLEALYLKEHEGRQAGAFALQIDLATQQNTSLRFTYLLAAFANRDAEGFETGADLTLAHTTLEYVLRLAGHTRHAPFDLSMSAGLSVDVLHPGNGSDLDVDGRARLSPYLSVDAAFWQSRSLGLLLHAGQAIPVNLTGGSSGTSDFSASFRVDVTRHVSVHAGYRILVVRARDYERGLSNSSSDQDYDGTLTGPSVGLEVRF